MARDRQQAKEARAAARAAATDERVAPIRRRARGWFLRSLMAMLVGLALAAVSTTFALLLVVVAIGCGIRALQVALEAQRAVERR
jgi:hypothetical protein